jgi:hypothetical protein
MTVTLELKPETEARLAAQAAEKGLPVREYLQTVIEGLAAAPEAAPKTRSIMELHGLGKEIWEGMDAQEYVNELRKEWDHRP